MSEQAGSVPRAWRGVFRVGVACTLSTLGAGPLAAAGLTVRHQPPACVLAEAFPHLEAAFEPLEPAVRLRVAFRPESATLWHAVAAEPSGGTFRAVLPRPRLAVQRVHYRFEAIAADASMRTSDEYSVAVVAEASACAGQVAESETSARVLVEVPPGAPMVPPVPAGFDPVGAVSATPHRATSKKKLGLLAGVVVGGGAVAGGVIAAGSEPPTPTLLLAPSFLVRSSLPPLFSQVSIAANNFSAEISVVTPRNLAPGEAWVLFYNPTHPPEQPCAVVAGQYPEIVAGREVRFPIRTPFVHAVACGLSMGARIVFRGTNGQTAYESGLSGDVGASGLLDASVSYTFVP